MTYPTKYSRQFDYLSYQNANPTRPLPGDRVNFDLNAVKQSVTEIVDFLKTSIRSDGQLMNKTVGRNQLADDVFLGFDAPTDWQPLTIYTTSSTVFHGNIFYKAEADHTSAASFDATKWEVIADFSTAVTAAAASADAAAASAASIVGDAAAAAVSAGAAAVSETNAAASETNAAASAASIPDKDIDSVAAAATTTIAASVNVVMVMGYAAAGDAPPAPYFRVGAEPAHNGKFQSADGAWWELERLDGVYLEDFGGVNASTGYGTVDGSVDNSAALTKAIDYAYKKRQSVIRINSGVWPCSQGGFEIPVGINFMGQGFSSALPGGSVLQANYNEATAANPFLHFTGAGADFNGTGGGIQNLTIQKGAGKTGGVLLKLTGVDDSNRTGYMTFQNLKISGTNQGANCDYCVILDGGNLTTVNTNGIRDVTWINLFIDGWAQEGMQLINATHGKMLGFNASPTGGNDLCLRITGNDSASTSKTTSFMAAGLECYGTLILDNADDCNIQCRATDLTVTGNATNCLLQAVVQNVPSFSGTIGGAATTRELLQTVNRTTIQDGRDVALYTDNGLTKVVGARATGWALATGTATRTTFVTSTVTTEQLAERFKALIDDLHATAGHGLLGT